MEGVLFSLAGGARLEVRGSSSRSNFLWLFLITSVTGSVPDFHPCFEDVADLPSGAGIQSYLTHAPKSRITLVCQPPCVYSMQTHVLIRRPRGWTVSCAVLSEEAEPRCHDSRVGCQCRPSRPRLWLLQTFKEKL